MASLPVRHSTAFILLARAWQKPWASSWLAFSLAQIFYLAKTYLKQVLRPAKNLNSIF
jgi:hypothetical protein